MQQKSHLALVLSGSLLSGLAGLACSPGGGSAPSAPVKGGSSGGSGGASGGSSGTGGSGSATGGRSGSGGSSASGGTSGATGGSSGQGGAGTGSGGSSGTGGGGATDAGGGDRPGSGGSTGGTGGTGGGNDAATTDSAGGGDGGGSARFSFFVTSLDGMRRLSKSQNGFGGDLRFGEATGLAGADKICQTLAADVGFGNKTWRAYLSAVSGPGGQPVHGSSRIGEGPWYDRLGRLIAMNKAGLFGTFNRPMGDAAAVNDLPDETGQGTKRLGDTHDVITGSNMQGELRFPGNLNNTCMDWTSVTAKGSIGMGHAWPASSGMHWTQAHTEPNCAAGVNLVQTGPGNGTSIGAGGGWGAFYCFALQP